MAFTVLGTRPQDSGRGRQHLVYVGSKNEVAGQDRDLRICSSTSCSASGNSPHLHQRQSIRSAPRQEWHHEYRRTNYFENVPHRARLHALCREATAMGHLSPCWIRRSSILQTWCGPEREAARDNQPYGGVDDLVEANIYPAGHPYSLDGHRFDEDLDAASMGMSLSGSRPITVEQCRPGDCRRHHAAVAGKKVERYYGESPRARPLPNRSWSRNAPVHIVAPCRT